MKVKKFEYKVVAMPIPLAVDMKSYEEMSAELEVQLNSLGAQGWELVQHKDGFLFFKREVA